MLDPDFRYALRDAGVRLTTYAEVVRTRRQPRMRSWLRLAVLLSKLGRKQEERAGAEGWSWSIVAKRREKRELAGRTGMKTE